MQPVTESRLTRIGLSYFQTISEYVQVPIGKLTLLFGPNSAGKSAIADALDVAHCKTCGYFEGPLMIIGPSHPTIEGRKVRLNRLMNGEGLIDRKRAKF